MSEARRKRQQERRVGESLWNAGLWKKYTVRGGIAVLFVLAFYAGWYYKNHKYDNFAKCLAAHQAKMYGLYWCPHCIEQKQMFGESFHYVPYVECAIHGSNEVAFPCKIAGVKLYPSWQFGAEQPKEGVLSLDALSDKTGCRLP
jgi:hypothetical protein